MFLRLQALPWVLASPLSLPATLPHALDVRLTGFSSQLPSSFRSLGSIECCSSSWSLLVAVELLEEPSCDFSRVLSVICLCLARGGVFQWSGWAPLPLEQLFHWPLSQPARQINCTPPPPLFPSPSLKPGDLSEAFPWLLLRTLLPWYLGLLCLAYLFLMAPPAIPPGFFPEACLHPG